MARHWKVLLVTSVAVFMGFLDVTIVNIAFPSISEHFSDSSPAALSWVLNAYNVVFAALLVPAGRAADRFGRKRMFLIGTAGFVVTSAACAFAPSLEVLVAARILQAAAAAVLVPTSLALLLPEFPVDKRAVAVGLWSAAGGIAAATGPSLGGLLVESADWRWVFLVNLPIGLAALIPARRILRESREVDPGPLPDVLGAGLLALGVGAVALAIVEGPDWGWGSDRVLGALTAGLVLLAALVARSRNHPAPVVEPGLFRVRSFAVANGGMTLLAIGFYAMLLCHVLFMTTVWQWSILDAGMAFTPGPLMAALSAAPAGRVADRIGPRPVALAGGLIFGVGTSLFALRLGTDSAYASEFLPAQLITGIGVGLSFASWGSAAVSELPAARFATGSAILSCSRQIGAVLGVAALIALIGTPSPQDALSTFHEAYWLIALAVTLSGLTALLLPRGRPAEATAASALPAPAREAVIA